MHDVRDDGRDLPPELREALAKDPYEWHRHADVMADWNALFEVLRDLHGVYPDWRFGQMVENLSAWSGTTEPGNPYDVPDGRPCHENLTVVSTAHSLWCTNCSYSCAYFPPAANSCRCVPRSITRPASITRI